MSVVEVSVGRSRWALSVRDQDLVPVREAPDSPVRDARAAVVDALERPIRFESFRRALTPDDRIALVVDESLPHLPELIAGVLEYLAGAGIPPSAVTAISPHGSAQSWVNDLPETMADLQTEVHQPGDRRRLSYLAATKDGRRIYLNRTLVDADQAVVLTGRGYDPLLGYSGGEGSLYPALADTDTVRSLVPKLSPQAAPDDTWPTRAEAHEVAWLLGSPFFVQVIEGPADEIASVVAGLAESTADGADRQNGRWKVTVPEAADTVVVTLSGDPARHDFAALARAAAAGARVVKPGGNVIVLSEADPELGGATDVLRRTDEPPEAVRVLFRERPADAAAAVQWAWAAGRAKLYLASEIRPTTVEEMFATPLAGPKDVQRLLNAPGRCLIVPDAHKTWLTLS
ncbi:MAG TPA: lactate racemase domain-containing protein [Gemmataceae bacterium]|nr:lactate racemase domain-containing protein [Gemmataceae bacterium]